MIEAWPDSDSPHHREVGASLMEKILIGLLILALIIGAVGASQKGGDQ
jgi:hypothetical protein